MASNGTYPLAAAMINQLNRVDTISNNLANANTNGFKQEALSEGSFNSFLQRAKEERRTPSKQEEVFNTVPKIDDKFINGTVGAVVPTGNELDFAISDPTAFFKVQDNNGNKLLTRDGAFKSLNGFLVNQNGYRVLNGNDQPILVEEGFAQNIALEKTEFSNLDKIGNNNYKVKDENKLVPIFNNEGIVAQGSLEKSNVNSVQSMVALIDAHRRFEQAQKAVQGIGETNANLVEKLGNTR